MALWQTPAQRTRHLIVLVLRNIAGVLLILIGVISGFLPIIQGWIFVLIGIALLEFPGKDRMIERIGKLPLIKPLYIRYARWRQRSRRKKAARRVFRNFTRRS